MEAQRLLCLPVESAAHGGQGREGRADAARSHTQPLLKPGARLGGSWVVRSGVISRVTSMMSGYHLI